MPKITIDDKILEVEDGLTVIQACEIAGVEIPRFCYHEKLTIAGNCRMCLVEMEKSPKLIASCAMPINDGMVIKTNTEKVKQSREGVMELLLINHPLDCPICDQGGECDLQDQAFVYGRGRNRFHENKRSVEDKDFGPLIKTHMTRCIQCTRCIRFSQEIAGIDELGAVFRGEHMEVTSYVKGMIGSELSGNLIDVCPVGALTSKPYEFKARSWELKHIESIDVLDAVGSNIRVDYRGLSVMRILPRINEEINEQWLDDRARFSYDALKNQRLDVPYIRKNGKLLQASWDEAYQLIANKIAKIKPEKMAALIGPMVDSESIFLLKTLFNNLGSNNLDANLYGYKIDLSSRANYLFNTTIAGIEQADLCLLIGANPRQKATMLNTRIKKAVYNNSLEVARIGEVDDQTYKITELGNNLSLLNDILSDVHDFSQKLKNAKYPMLIIGDDIYSREDGFSILSLIHQLVKKFNIVKDEWNGFNILHNHASAVGAMDLGCYSSSGELIKSVESGEFDLLYLLAADDVNLSSINREKTFVIYQGHHGDIGANLADVILPASAYTEKNAIYVNLEGRAQYCRRAVFAPGQARDDIQIIAELINYSNLKLNFDFFSLSDIRKEMAARFKSFGFIDKIIASDFTYLTKNDNNNFVPNKISKNLTNYYMTNTITKFSKTMAECLQAKRIREERIND